VDFAQGAKLIFGKTEIDVVLFGSYSRGDFDESLDVDIAILADITREYECNYTNDVVPLIAKIDAEYDFGLFILPIIISRSFFEEWSETIPFYKALKTEGVRMDVA